MARASRTKLRLPQKSLKPHRGSTATQIATSSPDASKIADLRGQLARMHQDRNQLVNAIRALIEDAPTEGVSERFVQNLDYARDLVEQLG